MKVDNDYLEYAYALNVENIRKFSLAVCIICLLLLMDRSGPNPNIAYSNIFNSQIISILFFTVYISIWITLKFFSKKIHAQKIVVWVGVFAAYCFSGSLTYLSVATGSGITALALAYLLISVLFTERLVLHLPVMYINGALFYFLVHSFTAADTFDFRIGLGSVIFLSSLVAITMDKQRRDVFYSQKKIAEKVLELNRALDVKAAFFGHMSHELRTPLNAIIGFSDMLKNMASDKLTTDKVREYAEFINSGGNHLLSLVNDLLDQNKIEAGEINLSIETITVGELLDSYVSELKPISVNKNQRINLNLTDARLDIETDRRLFKQIIYNLLSNAQKYTQNDGQIDLYAKRSLNDQIEITIKDDGKGIPKEVLNQIGNSDLPLKSHFISQAEGTGLGLIIVRQLIYRLGAGIDIKSTLDEGTEVTLSFPPQFAENTTH